MKEGLLRLDLGDERSGRLKHERLKAHLVNEMIAGRLKPGQALPSESQFAQMLDITRPTIRQAMASLESDGLIRRVQGKGNFVEADVRRKLNQGLDIFALVVPQTRMGFYPSLLHGFEDASNQFHVQTIVCNTNNDVAQQGNSILQLLDKKVGGVALVPTGEPLTPAFQVRQLQDRGIPVVYCHRRVENVPAPLLAIPFREIGHLAGKALAEHGHHRVAFFTYQATPTEHSYEEGLREALCAGGGDVSVELAYTGGDAVVVTEEMVWATLQRVFAKPDPPTAIFASFDTLAETIYLLLPRLGLRVPEDVSLVGVGGAWREGAIIRRLTSVVIDETDTGRRAVALLHEMRNGNRPIDDNEQFVLPLDLCEGETLARPALKI